MALNTSCVLCGKWGVPGAFPPSPGGFLTWQAVGELQVAGFLCGCTFLCPQILPLSWGAFGASGCKLRLGEKRGGGV